MKNLDSRSIVLRTWQNRFRSILLFLSIAFTASLCPAEEPGQAFVDAMRANGYYDLTIEYLTRIESSPTISKEFRSRLPLEKARTLVQSVSRIKDLEKREVRLEEAQAQLEIYKKGAKDPNSRANAEQEQASLARFRAQIFIKRSESDRLTASEKEEQLSKARQLLQSAMKGYQASMDGYQAARKALPKDATATQKKDILNKFLTAKLYVPLSREILADTFKAKPKKQKQILTETVNELSEMWKVNNSRGQGVEACLRAAHIYRELKSYDKSLDLVYEVLNFPDGAVYRDFKRRAGATAADCSREMKKFPQAMVLEKLEPYVVTLNKKEKLHPDWLKIQLQVAKAYRGKAKQVEEKGGKSSEISRWNGEAATLARFVSRNPSPVRDEARALLEQWNLKVRNPVDPVVKAVETFPAAMERARDAITEGESLATELTQKGQVDEANKQLRAETDKALGYLKTALRLADETVSREDLNRARYMQCFCYYRTERYFETTILGEFLLDRYANVAWTQKASGLVVKSYRQLYRNAGEENAFERKQLTEVCDRVIKRWPGTTEAASAADTMAKIALKEKQYAVAYKYLESMPADSPARGPVALVLGRNLWFEHKADDPKTPQKLESVVRLLTEGVNSSTPDNLTYEGALGALLLVQAYSEKDDIENALQRLESPKVAIAPLDLVKQKHPTIEARRDIYTKETYRTAIEVYLKAMRAGDAGSYVEKAKGVLAGLKEILAAEGEAGQAKLVRVQQKIAAELKQQFEVSADKKQRISIANSANLFMKSLSEDQSSDAATVLWAGRTMLEMAETLGDLNPDLQRKMYANADTALNRASDIGFAGDENAADKLIELKRLRAIANRGAGEYAQAVELLEEVLRLNNNSLTAQLDAAKTLQQWGQEAQRNQTLGEAIQGRGTFTPEGARRAKTLIWGWRGIVSRLKRNEKLKPRLLEANYGFIESMFEYHKLTGNEDAMKAAKREIDDAKQADPEFGGAPWTARYQALEKRINSN